MDTTIVSEADEAETRPEVGLFVTCLVDLFRPSVAFAAVRLLEHAGCTVVVPPGQVCCGQPAYNNGDLEDTRAIARQVIAAFEGLRYVVAPSGSCAGMLRVHYPTLFDGDAAWMARANALSERTYELTSFLVDVLGVDHVPNRSFHGAVTYHDSCSCLRELGIHRQPRHLLETIEGLRINQLESEEECCGFGGTFCIKYPEISDRMVSLKAEDIEASGAGTVLAADLGCLLNIAGKLSRRGSTVDVRHIAELLADTPAAPAIGKSRTTAKDASS